MKKIILLTVGLAIMTLQLNAQMETKVNTFNRADNAAIAKKEVKAFSYSLGNLDLCIIAPIEKGTVYRIQFTTMEGFYNDFSQFVAERAFGEIYPEYVLNKDLTRYLLGDFQLMNEAKDALERMLNLGHEQAFIVPYVDGKRKD